MADTGRKRIYSFDLLKIISILAVFMHHIMMDMYVVHPMHNLSILHDLIIRPNMNLGMIACGLFVFISGATLALKKGDENLLAFYSRRLTRVLIPFYIAYIIAFGIKVFNLGHIHVFGGIAKWRFIYTIIGMDEYLHANGMTTFTLGVGEWFLGCIILCYLVYPLLKAAHRKYTIFTFVLMTIYFLVFNYNYDRFNFVIPSHMNFLSQIYNFYLGIVLVDERCISKIKKWFNVITILVIAFLYFYMKPIPMPDNLKTTIGVVALYVTFYNFEKYISSADWFKQFVAFFSKISLEIYLVHHFVIYQVDYILGYKQIGGVMTLTVVAIDLVLTVIIAIAVEKLSGFFYRFLEKSKNK